MILQIHASLIPLTLDKYDPIFLRFRTLESNVIKTSVISTELTRNETSSETLNYCRQTLGTLHLAYEGVSESFQTESITKNTLTTIKTH
jgi:hypothetical protein